jgi:phage-related minor tail protein
VLVSNVCMKRSVSCRVVIVVASLTVLAPAQSKSRPLPCSFTDELLQNSKGQPLWFKSDQMKTRATYKEDIGSFLKQADVKGTAMVDVLVNSAGGVACVKSLAGHPIVRSGVEKALKKWTFKTASQNGHAVAYLGEMEFSLCNISCGDAGPSMTILK